MHGLQAMLLLDAANHQPAPARPFQLRGVRPLFHFETLRTLGRPNAEGGHDLFAANGDGAVTMQAVVHWRDG